MKTFSPVTNNNSIIEGTSTQIYQEFALSDLEEQVDEESYVSKKIDHQNRNHRIRKNIVMQYSSKWKFQTEAAKCYFRHWGLYCNRH